MSRITVTREGPLLFAALTHEPDNRIDLQTLTALESLCQQVDADRGIRVVIFHSPVECGFGLGIDLDAVLTALDTDEPGEVEGFIERSHAVFGQLDRLGVLTVGVLHGLVFGGSLELALCLDVLIAEDRCRFALPELRLGLIPGFGGLARLQRRCGQGLARELLMSGRSLGVRRAVERGLVDHRVPRGDGLEAGRALAYSSATLDRGVLEAAKGLLAAGLQPALARERGVLSQRLRLPSTRDQIAQTIARRDPWKHLPPPPSSS